MYKRKSPACIDKKDSRYPKHKSFYKETGVWPDETWNLDCRIAEFLAPRLEIMAETIGSPPVGMTLKKWKKLLKEAAKSCRSFVKGGEFNEDADSRLNIQEFLGKHFFNLWG